MIIKTLTFVLAKIVRPKGIQFCNLIYRDDAIFICSRCGKWSTTDRCNMKCNVQKKGLGDYLELLFKKLGFEKKLVGDAKAVQRGERKPCGCGRRQAIVNQDAAEPMMPKR